MTSPPGYRPDAWGTAGDHEKRIRTLEAVPPDDSCCLDSGADSFEDFVLSQPSLWAYWPLNDASGSPQDIFGNHDLTVHGGTFTYQQTGPFADQPSASSLAFSGVSSWLGYDVVPADVDLVAWTWIGWVYYQGTSANAIFSFHNGAAGGSARQSSVYVAGTDELFLAHAATTVGSGDTLPSSAWHFVAATYAGSVSGVMNLYLDGVLIGTLTDNDTFLPDRIRVGAQGNPTTEGNFWKGRMAQVALFSSVLSAADIADAASRVAASASAGMVPTADGAGGYDWDYPTIGVTY